MATKKTNNKLFEDLTHEIDNLQKNLDLLKEDVDAIQHGNGNDPYWNGENAVDTIKNIVKYIDVNNSIVSILNDCKDLQK